MRRGRPKKEPDRARVGRAMRMFREMTTAEKRLFLIEAIEFAPEAVPGLAVSISIGETTEEKAERLWNTPLPGEAAP